MTLKWYFLRWLSYVGMFIGGMLGVLSFGFWNSGFELKSYLWFLDYAEKTEQLNRKGKMPNEL